MKKYFLWLPVVLLSVTISSRAQVKSAPPDSPAFLKSDGNKLMLVYNGKEIFKAVTNSPASDYYIREVIDSVSGKINQSFTITSVLGKKLMLSGEIKGSSESFPCQADPQIRGTVLVRSSFGLSRSLLNRAVYDRASDWVLSVDESYASSDLIISPEKSGSAGNKFLITVNGSEITFRFRPRYYSFHRGLSFFEPWNYSVWRKSVAGWCSWFAFKNDVTESDIHRTVDILEGVMKPFGLGYIQIDDGYQHETSYPEMWLEANGKFPSGMKNLADYIHSKGFIPGIWTNVAFSNKKFAERNPSMFVTDECGSPVTGRWIGYIMDGSNPETIAKLIKQVYSGFAASGWKYFKLDALRHLRYEGYNSNSGYFIKKDADRVEAFRSVALAVRNEIGRDNFLLACWGIRSELVGIADGCRIGDDGFGLQALTQYNSFNNIVWRNDPDHIELTPKEAYRSCMVTSLTGSLFMLTDKPDIYKTALIEPAKRSLPVLFTLPGQIYDVDPSRSDNLYRVNSEMSGSGERVFDASRTSPYDLFLLEINKPFGSWMMLGRTGEKISSVTFKELGFPAEEIYLVFEFWSKKFLGEYENSFAFGGIDSTFNYQLFAIRLKENHPQLLATNRHISCGAMEIEQMEWKENVLSGKSSVVGNDTYVLYIHEKSGFVFQKAECEGARPVGNKINGNVREISIHSDESKTIEWKIFYNKL